VIGEKTCDGGGGYSFVFYSVAVIITMYVGLDNFITKNNRASSWYM